MTETLESIESLRRERVWSAIDHFIAPGMRVLDIGAGPGVFSEMLLRQGCTVTAIEAADNHVASLHKLAASNSRLAVVQDTFPPTRAASELQLGNQDAALVLGVIEQVENPSEFLRSVGRILRPRGRLLISTASPKMMPAALADVLENTGFRILSRETLLRLPYLRSASVWPLNRLGFNQIFVAERKP